jgi:triacylglycerol lipase
MITTQSNPILLLHGIWDTGAIFDQMSRYLRAKGHSVYTLDLEPNNGDAPLEYLAEQVAVFAAQTFGTQLFDLVGFSMGGLVGRYYMQRLGGIEQVQRFITLSSPHNGTLTAHGSFCSGGMQMRPNSSFLRDLNQDITQLNRINFTSIWTPLDAMIVPASSSIVPIGKQVLVWVPLHAWMVSDSRGILAVAEALAEPLKSSAEFSYVI